MVFCQHRLRMAGRPINLCCSQSHDLSILGTQLKVYKIQLTMKITTNTNQTIRAKTKIQSGKEDMITHRLSQIQMHFTLENRHSTTSEAIRVLSTASSSIITINHMLPIFASGVTAHVAFSPPSWMNTNNPHLPYSSATHPAPNSNSQIPQW